MSVLLVHHFKQLVGNFLNKRVQVASDFLEEFIFLLHIHVALVRAEGLFAQVVLWASLFLLPHLFEQRRKVVSKNFVAQLGVLLHE